jgi:transposase InsO family protein
MFDDSMIASAFSIARFTVRSNQRWAMDLTHVPCGTDGWGHLTAAIDCHDREIAGFEFALRGRAQEAERALEEDCLARFGTLGPDGPTPVVRSDNGLFFKADTFALLAATIGCARSSSLLIRLNRMASLSASFAASRSSVFGSPTSATSPMPKLSLLGEIS